MKPLAFLVLCTAMLHGQTAPGPSLKDAYKGLFRIGAALNRAEFENRDPKADPIIQSQFNTISPENYLKWQSVHPTLDRSPHSHLLSVLLGHEESDVYL